MKGCPFEYQRHGSPRELSPENGERVNLNESIVFAIFGVEMCRAVVSKVHSKHNPQKTGYLRHFFSLFYPLRTPSARKSASATSTERGGLASAPRASTALLLAVTSAVCGGVSVHL